jgi:hypothetical protein
LVCIEDNLGTYFIQDFIEDQENYLDPIKIWHFDQSTDSVDYYYHSPASEDTLINFIQSHMDASPVARYYIIVDTVTCIVYKLSIREMPTWVSSLIKPVVT